MASHIVAASERLSRIVRPCFDYTTSRAMPCPDAMFKEMDEVGGRDREPTYHFCGVFLRARHAVVVQQSGQAGDVEGEDAERACGGGESRGYNQGKSGEIHSGHGYESDVLGSAM